MKCCKCGHDFPPGSKARAAISIYVLGDEYIYSYWRCDVCRHYTIEAYYDKFLGDSSVSFLPPLPEAAGDRGVELIRACPAPYDKLCECPSHKALYYGVPSEG